LCVHMAHEIFVGRGDGVGGGGVHEGEFKGGFALGEIILFLMLDSGNGDLTLG
jgi:hypothetical protein